LHTLYICHLFGNRQQPVTVYKTSTYSTHHTRLHTTTCVIIITTGIGIGTRIGIGAGKKYRVSEVSANPGIGLSLKRMGCNKQPKVS